MNGEVMNGEDGDGEGGDGEEVAVKGDSPQCWTRDGCEKRATVAGVARDVRRTTRHF